MMPLEEGHHKSHFHIRWDRKLDWEPFATDEEARARAKELVQPGENYKIETFDGSCPACEGFNDNFGKARFRSVPSLSSREG